MRIDGDAKRMHANLDYAFAGKRFRVDDRDLIVVAIRRHHQRAIGRHSHSGRRRADLDGGGDGAGREIDLIEARLIEPGDVDKAARRIGCDAERRIGNRNLRDDLARRGVDHRDIFAFRARDIGGAPIAGHGDPGGLAQNRNPRHDLH